MCCELCLNKHINIHWNLLLRTDTWTERHVHVMIYTNTLTNTICNMAVHKSTHSQLQSLLGVNRKLISIFFYFSEDVKIYRCLSFLENILAFVYEPNTSSYVFKSSLDYF